MRKAENVNAPWLGGWVIGAAAGVVAFGVLVVVGKFDLFPAAALAVVVAGLAGLVLGMPWGSGAGPAFERSAVPEDEDAPVAKPEAAPVVAAAMTQPVAFVSAPVAGSGAAATKPRAAKAKPATPKAATPKPTKAKVEGPARLKAARKGKADDLKEIEGIGPAMEKLVNELGFYHFDQIAGWSDADVDWVDANMKTFKGRITRDKWVAQAKIIVSEGLEAFRERAKTNNY